MPQAVLKPRLISSGRMTADERRERLLAAALDLFSRQGFAGTTTKQIAHLAGVTEAIVFRHFPNKEELYWAVIEQQCALRDGRARTQALLASSPGHTDDELFAAFGEDILVRNSTRPHLPRLLLFSALEDHKLSHRFFRTYISEYYEVVADHIRERIRAGKFRDVDPLLAARGFIGMFFYHFLIQDLFGGKKVQQYDPKVVGRTLTDLWLQGMAAQPLVANNGHNGKNGTHPHD
jgi:AcrR family transcriptional regulator